MMTNQEIFIIVGLGNPGTRYENTRHNVGFDAIDLLAKDYGISVSKLKHKALLGDGSINGKRVLLVKPQTFMNLSGESVREIIEWYKVPSKNVIILYDDIDLPFAKIRVRPKGSAGTHNGMRSILFHLKTEEFPRVRIGIDKAPEGYNLADYVLSKFSNDERIKINEALKEAAAAAVNIVRTGAV